MIKKDNDDDRNIFVDDEYNSRVRDKGARFSQMSSSISKVAKPMSKFDVISRKSRKSSGIPRRMSFDEMLTSHFNDE